MKQIIPFLNKARAASQPPKGVAATRSKKMRHIIVYILLTLPLLAQAQPPMADGLCSQQCIGQKDNPAYEACLCDCLLSQAQTLRQEENFEPAILKLRAVAALCPERDALAIIDSIYQEHRIWVYQNGKFAVATPLGRVLSPFMYDDPQPFTRGMAVAEMNDKLFFVGKNGELLTPRPGYEAIIPAEGELYYCVKEEDQGLTYRNNPQPFFWKGRYERAQDSLLNRPLLPGNERMLSQLDVKTAEKIQEDAGRFNQDIPGLHKESQRAFFDTAETVITSLNIEFTKDFNQGISWVKKDSLPGLNGVNENVILSPHCDSTEYINQRIVWFNDYESWGLIDTNGAMIFRPLFEDVWNFSQGFAKVRIKDKWGFINTNGILITPIMFEDAWNFNLGFARVRINGRWGFIDTGGSLIAPPQYEYIEEFSQGFARILKDGGWGFIDTSGVVIAYPQYEDVGNFSQGFAKVRKNGRWGFINTSGTIISRPYYEKAENFKQGFARILKDGWWGFINTNGVEIFRPKYDEVEDFSHGFARVQKDGQWGFIDTHGEEIIPLILDNSVYTSIHLYLLYANDKLGLLFEQEKTYIPPEYDDIEVPREGEDWLIVRKGTKYGWVDHSGSVKIPIRYDAVAPFRMEHGQERAWVYQYGLQYQINRKGEMVWW